MQSGLLQIIVKYLSVSYRLGIVYKKTDEWYNEWQRVTTSGITRDKEWQPVTTNDSEWYNEWQRVTMNDSEWQQVTKNDNELQLNNSEW